MSPIQFPDEGVENFVKLGLEQHPKRRILVQITWGGEGIDNHNFPKGAFAYVDHKMTPDQLNNLFARKIKAAEADAINQKYDGSKKMLILVSSEQVLVLLRTGLPTMRCPA